ncbi:MULTISPECIES: filamentous hemagglutinin N-terminal domain-containing protein [unclassified Okeania]|uniref:two-partner secretion domain-containing protein n=2 Tax=Okeania TaxID=1458928 RepID=UPI0013B9CBAD|nr:MULTISPECIES: filamentous hemagglutinin N-terminal domain-containing protein [unclassified Okeania]NES76390.1 S-layer family protein [Okeania sp. SIO1H4]NET14559.1 S-layer family protein [Okeania sp. SIO1H6]NET19837.1 S-layer family protein [Okeania sp. SIO1H5]NET94733.1 S-layer family protein [Okeania sp. SIO1H2]
MKSHSSLFVVSLTFFLWNFFSNWKTQANAQIVPDNTLGEESSVVNSIDELKDQIEGGAIRGSNLFHSFQEFNIREGRSVYFINPNGIENILTRITGNNPSSILGKLGVDGGANLFLVNPQGIFFGPNASLDIRGSFIATTADEIRLGQNGLFSATAPHTSNLLSVEPSALFSNQLETRSRGAIINQSTHINQSTQEEVGLELPGEQTLALVGGDIEIDGGRITVPQGRIELGSIGNNSVVRLNPRNKGYDLDYSEVDNFQDVNIASAFIDTQGSEGGGDISIQGRRIIVTELSEITGDTNGSEPGGNIEITASQVVEVVSSEIFSDVREEATANGGNIDIETQRLILRDGSVIAAETFGEGNAGNLTIHATYIEARDFRVDEEGFPVTNFIASGVQLPEVEGRVATGEGGTLTIETQRLSLRDGSQIDSSTASEGKAGSLIVRAKEIELIGVEDVFSSGLFASVQEDTIGDGGDLIVETQSLSIQDGALVGVFTFGAGDAGELNIKANEIEVIGRSEDGNFPSTISATVRDDGEFRSSGNGGEISIETNSLTIRDGATVEARTEADGTAGSIAIRANNNITVSGFSSISGDSSAITAGTESGATGKGGSIEITTPILNIDNGALITARSKSDFDGGNISLNISTLNLTAGGQVITSSFGSGNAGTIEVSASDRVLISGIDPNVNEREELGMMTTDREIEIGGSPESAIASRATDNGDAGSVIINTPLLRVEDRGIVTVSSSGEGVAGSLNVNAPSIELNNGTLAAETNAGDEGNITINSSNISLENKSSITTRAEGNATGGNITIDTRFSIARDGSQINANADQGQGGNIDITADGLFFDNSSSLTASSALGIDGTIDVNTQVDPTQGVVTLSPEVVDAESVVAQNLCLPNQDRIAGSSFVITGRGGLPPNPTQPLTVLRGVVDWETGAKKTTSSEIKQQTVLVYQRQQSKKLPEILQAQGWVMNTSGNIILTATSPTVNTGSLQLIHPGCYLLEGTGNREQGIGRNS